MERRAVIRNLLTIAGGITLLPACLNNTGKASVELTNIDLSAADETLLAEIASTIIPQTDTPGAKEVGSHLFVLKMVDDCYEKEDQQNFVRGLNLLEKHTRQRFNKSFISCSNEQKKQMLEAIENKESFEPEVAAFYKIMKEKTIQGYMTSKYVVMDVLKYEMIPSVPYNGYHPVKNISTDGR
ncbi:MAG: gluconate 2-dehydrogenase subunit 3 family protein [Chitinophagaceae bacterium]|nr:MAG: gluconate 2-dehydrogenase subunit 3 family protein [Chitinophagaceae bacterium]